MMKNKSTRRSVLLSKFGGMDLRCPVGASSASSSVNYRIMPDGSIKKRNGYKRRVSLPTAPSGIASVCRNGEKQLIAVAGDRLYSVDLEGGGYTELPGRLPNYLSETSPVQFRDRLLVFDGQSISLVGDEGISSPTGYAPLYGNGWHPRDRGPVFEPRNILSRGLRIMYRGVEGMTTLTLPDGICAIVGVELDGLPLAPESYAFDPLTLGLTSEDFGAQGCEILVFCRLSADHSELARLNACLLTAVVGSGGRSVLFCSRTAEAPHLIYRSTPVGELSLAESARGFSESDEFYFPENGVFSVGSDDLAVRAILPLDDRVIVYNDDEAWLVPSSSEELPDPALLCGNVGCTAPGAAVICGDLPFSLCGNGIYCWAPELEAYTELSAVLISAPIASLIDDRLAKRGRLISDRDNRELWLYDPQDSTRDVLVYDRDGRHWYCFGGFSPELTFYHDGRLGFTDGRHIYVFSPDYTCDSNDGATDRSISTSYCTGWLDAASFDEEKISERLAMKLEGSLFVRIEYDSGVSEGMTLCNGSTTSAPTVINARLGKKRFRQLRFFLSDTEAPPSRVYSIAFFADAAEGVCELYQS